MKAQSGTEFTKELPAGYRHYKIMTEVNVQDKSPQSSITAVSVIDDLQNIKRNDFFGTLGLHSINPANFKDVLALNKKLGMNWMECYHLTNLDCDPNWRTDESRWRKIEFVVDNIIAQGFVPVIKIDPVRFLKKNAAGIEIVTEKDEHELYEWSREIARRFKDKIHYYDVFNEYMKGELEPRALNVRKLMPCVYQGLKDADPTCVVVACSEDTARSRQMQYQLEAHFKLGTLTFMDAVGVHPYVNPGTPESEKLQLQYHELQEHMKKYNSGIAKPIWGTESGYRAVDTLYYDDVEPESMYYPAHVTELEQAERIVRDNVIAMGEGVQRYQTFYLDPGPRFFSFSFIQRENGIRPKTTMPAFAFMVKNLSGAVPVKRFEQQQNSLMGYFFRKEGRLFAIVWRYSPDNVIKKSIISLPANKLKVFNLVGEELKTASGKDLELPLGGSAFYLHPDGIADSEFMKAMENIKVDNLTLKLKLMDSNKVETTVINSGGSNAEGTLEINNGKRSKFLIKPGEKQITVTSLAGTEMFKATIDSNKGKLSSELRLLFPAKTDKNIVINGDLTAFSNAVPIKLDDKNRFSHFTGVKYGGEKDLSAELRTMWDEHNFYIGVNVRDDIHSAPYSIKTKPAMIWANDALQIAFKRDKDLSMTEINFSLTKDGPGVYATIGKPDITKIKYAIKRTGDTTTYEIAIPWNAIWSNFSTKNNIDTQFNIAINDHDGILARKLKIPLENFVDNKQSLQLTPGIVDSKASEQFRYLVFE